MTEQARVVLRDCEFALRDLRSGANPPQWRTRWVATVACLRAVGHVLQKVDGPTSPDISMAINRAWADLNAKKPEPRIFWDFIEQERNNVVKAYQRAAKQNVTIDAGTVVASGAGVQVVRPKIMFHHVMDGGYFHGHDPRDLVAKAIEWWRAYLDKIDDDVKRSSGAPPA